MRANTLRTFCQCCAASLFVVLTVPSPAFFASVPLCGPGVHGVNPVCVVGPVCVQRLVILRFKQFKVIWLIVCAV